MRGLADSMRLEDLKTAMPMGLLRLVLDDMSTLQTWEVEEARLVHDESVGGLQWVQKANSCFEGREMRRMGGIPLTCDRVPSRCQTPTGIWKLLKIGCEERHWKDDSWHMGTAEKRAKSGRGFEGVCTVLVELMRILGYYYFFACDTRREAYKGRQATLVKAKKTN